MMVMRRWQPQLSLKKTVQGCGGLNVHAAHHVGDALQCVVRHHCNVITRSNMALGDHCVTPCGGLRVVSATHVEAPAHFYPDGKDVTSLPLESFFGRAVLLDVPDAAAAQALDGAYLDRALGDLMQAGDIVICRNSDLAARPSPCLTPEAALWLRDRQVKMVGIDQHFRLGATITAARALHDILMSRDVCLVEFLDHLAELRRREFFFMALPFQCAQIDSAPARAIAIEER